MKRCIFIRHAATSENTKKKYIGCRTDTDILPPDAADIGRTVGAVAAKITGTAAFFCGPMKRVKSTAEALFPDKSFTELSDLYEIDFGDFEGFSYEELKDVDSYRAWIESGGTGDFPGGEGRESFKKRCMKALYEAIDASENPDALVIVCHGGNIMAIMGELTGEDYYDFLVDNLDGYVVDIKEDDKGISLISYDRLIGGACG